MGFFPELRKFASVKRGSHVRLCSASYLVYSVQAEPGVGSQTVAKARMFLQGTPTEDIPVMEVFMVDSVGDIIGLETGFGLLLH